MIASDCFVTVTVVIGIGWGREVEGLWEKRRFILCGCIEIREKKKIMMGLLLFLRTSQETFLRGK